MKTGLQRTLAFILTAASLLQVGGTAFALDAGTEEPVYAASAMSSLDEKSAELAKKLAEKGISKAIGKIPVIGGAVNSIAGPYIKKLLGIKSGESTNDKLDKLDTKLNTLMDTVEKNSQIEMQKIYESKFDDFHTRLLSVKNKTKEYLKDIKKYDARFADTDDKQYAEEEKTLLIAGLSRSYDFNTYVDNITILSQYVTGDVIQLHQDGSIYEKAYKVYCSDVFEKDQCALGGEAAIQSADYVNAINEVIDTAHTTAAMMLLARCGVGDSVATYRDLQKEGEITSDISLQDFNGTDSDNYRTKYEILKELHYDIFGVTEEDVAAEEAAAEDAGTEKSNITVKNGVVGDYNQMIEDRWFDYIEGVDFSGNIPVVSFVPMDGSIGFASLEDLGYNETELMALGEDSAVSYCKTLSKKILANKHSALSDAQFKNLMKHIATSPDFKYEKAFEGADDQELSLREALIQFGFSFDGFDASIYNSDDYADFFVTNAKCAEDYENTWETHDAYIDGYVYGIDTDLSTEEINGSSAEKSHQYFKASYSSHLADKKKTNFPKFVMLYFKNTTTVNSTEEFRNFLQSIADGNNYAGNTVVLNCDVNLSQTNLLKLWPDGKRSNEFCGTFDGNGYTVYGLNITAGEHRLALFRTTGDGAVIRNLNFENVHIENTAEKCGYAALVGFANGNLTVENVTVNSGSIAGYKYVGGIVGESKEGKSVMMTLSGCVNNVPITSSDTDAGGLLGNVAGADLFSCTNAGAVTAKKGAAGGLTGYIGTKDTDPPVYVENCTNTGTIEGYDCAGGICGHIYSDNGDTRIVGNQNSGNVTVTGKNSAGGIVGRTCTGGTFSENFNMGNIQNLATGDAAHAGGILGENEDDGITIIGNENTGRVTAYQRAGGIAGTLGDRDHDKACQISTNKNRGRISSQNKDAAGIIGAVATDNTSHKIENNSNSGTVEGKNNAGGIVGWMAGGGLFDSNSNNAKIVSFEYDAGGIAGAIQDDTCNFRNSRVGSPLCYSGANAPRIIGDYDYVIQAKNSKKHANTICGWDGKRDKTISSDNLLASLFGNGSIVLIVCMSLLLVGAAVVIVLLCRKMKNKQNR